MNIFKPVIRILRLRLKILFLSLLAFLSFNFHSCHLFKSKGYEIKTTAFFITLEDGTKLDCTKFYPDADPPPGGWSALIYCHGFGRSKIEDSKSAEQFAKRGYYTIVYSMRGQGLSTGLSNLISITEANDFTKVVEYVRNEPFVNPERVGAIGGSQGGTVPFMAVCNGLDLRCIVSSISTPELSTTWIENNSIKMTLLWSLSYNSTIVRYDPTVARMRDWILEDTPEKWDSLIFYLPQGRDFMNKVPMSKTPIFVSTVWQDKFFNSYGMLKTIDLLNVPYRMYFGTLDAHGADPYKPQMTYNDTISAQWVEYWLGNIQNGCLDSNKFVCVSSTYPREAGEKQVMWNWQPFYSNTWPPDEVEKIKFYFDTDNKLSNVPLDSNTIFLRNEIKDTSLNILEAVNREFTSDIFNSKFTKSELIFETAPLKQPCRLAGTPFVKLFYESDTVIAQFNFQVWEVKQSGEANIVTRANFTNRSIEPNVIYEVLFNGISFSHLFGQDSKIRIIITNLDNIPDDPFLRTNPHVLPSMVNAKNTIYNSKTKPTYVELPLIDYVQN